jgi:carbonic anhydrase/acetyltransferase-like protein (isoleucine patch superfamily)
MQNNLNETLKYLNQKPFLASSVFCATNVSLIGQVQVDEDSSLWFGSVLRADSDSIYIGKRTNIQDNTVIHVDPGCPVVIGDDCTIGHLAIVHGAILGHNVLVGMNAVILNKAKIGNNVIIGANALITQGMEIPDNSLVLGSPAKVVKVLNTEQIESIQKNADVYVVKAKAYLKAFDSANVK